MARIFCQVMHRADRITFLWSEGAANFESYQPFEPYHLEGAERVHLLQLAEQIHATGASAASGELATLGHQLYRAVFRRDASDYGSAEVVQTWLTKLIATDGIEKLEFLSDTPGLIPWNVLTEEPTGRFWGARFNLTTGRRINALRQNPTQVHPTQLTAAELDLAEPLLDSLRVAGRLVHSATNLRDSLASRAPDIFLLLVRYEKGQLRLGADAFTVGDLQAWLAEAKDGNPDPLVILAAAGAPTDQAAWQTALANASMAFSGLVANETLLSPAQAATVGIAIAQRFAEGKQNLGEILRTLRGDGGAALTFSAFCPPHMCVVAEGATNAPKAELPVEIFPLPVLPYRPFAAFEASDRPLLFGREEDTLRGALATDDPHTGCVLLHGSPAVGKTSYLQASLLPYLEQECVGYRVLRDRSPLEAPVAERDYPILILRCTSDLAGQFADALSVFCAQPLTYTTPTGTQVTVDLPTLLQQAVAGMTTSATAIQSSPAASSVTATPGAATDDDAPAEPMSARELWIALRDDKEMLGRVLDTITRPLPFELVIAVDQGEEMLTQVSTVQQQDRRQKAIDMLTQLPRIAPRCKILYTIRTQSLGEFVSLFADGKAPAEFRPFYLRALSEAEMVDALLWPTNRAEVPYSDEIPNQKYAFTFEDGFAQQIVAEAVAASATTQQSPLPLVHAVGELLYEVNVQEKKQDTLHPDDLKQLGGVKDALAKYLDRKLDRLTITKQARKALRNLISKFYIGHADGTLSTDLLLASELNTYWTYPGEAVEPIVNQAADEQGLFAIQEFLIGGQPSVFVSLPQDSLAQLGRKIASETDQHAIARVKVNEMLWIMIPLMFLAAAITFWGTRYYAAQQMVAKEGRFEDIVKELQQKDVAKTEKIVAQVEQILRELRPPQYFGLLAQADLALRTDNAMRARILLKSQPAMLVFGDGDKTPDLRGFEWKYLWRYLNSERHLLEGHAGIVNAVAISPDSQRAASVSNATKGIKDSAIRIWNLQTGEILALMPEHRTPTFAVAFSPDGKMLATAGADKIIRLWDLKDLKNDYVEITKEKATLQGHTDAIHALAFGKDANTLASAGADKTLILWDIAGNKAAHTLRDHTAAVRTLAFTSDGKTLVSAGGEATLILWDADTGTKRQAVKTPYQAIASLGISSDGKTLCTAGVETRLDAESGVLRFWTIADGKETHKPIPHGTGILSVAFAPGGKAVASGGKDRVIRLFDVETGKEKQKWIGHLGFISALAYARDSSALVSGSYDRAVKVWNPMQSSGADVIAAHDDWVQAIVLNRKNTLLASGSRDGTVKLWDPKTCKLLKGLPAHKGAVTSLAFSHHKDTDKVKDKLILAVGTRDDKNEGEIKLWQIELDPKTGYSFKELRTLKEHAKGVTSLAFSPNEEKLDILVSGSADQTVKVWNSENGKVLYSHHGHTDEVRCVAFASDGIHFVSGGKDALLCVYQLDGKDFQKLPNLQTNAIESVAVTPGSTRDDHNEVAMAMLVGGADQSIQISGYFRLSGEPGKGENVRMFRSHSQSITSVLQHEKNPNLIASASWDGTIKLYDTSSERFTLVGHQGAVRALAFAADQSFLASAGNDGTIRIWRTFSERVPEKRDVEKK